MNERMNVNVKTVYCQIKYKGMWTWKALKPFYYGT